MKPPFTPSEPPERMSPLALAYVGDAVLELIVRLYLVCGPRRRPDDLNREAVRWVSAKGQAELWERWEPLLTDEEREMARRGRNAESGRKRRGSGVRAHRTSTALECLIGYWFLTGRTDRLVELFRNAAVDAASRPDDNPVLNGEGSGGES